MTITDADLNAFIMESNAIENIHRMPTLKEVEEAKRFLGLKQIKIEDMEKFVSVYAPGNRLRTEKGCDVMIGGLLAPLGGVHIGYRLQKILDNVNYRNGSAYEIHMQYEQLHPFTDGNGRSGRMLWLWQMQETYEPKWGFLRSFYYQSFQQERINRTREDF